MEFCSDFYAYNDVEPCDILIIAGDFTIASYFNKGIDSPYSHIADECRAFFLKASMDYKHVFYIPGNHEAYKGYFDDNDEILARELSGFSNVHYLQNKSFTYEGVKFIGGTLWTNCYNSNLVAMNTIRHCLNDYRVVNYRKYNYRKFTPEDSIDEHNKTLRFFTDELKNCDKAVIISHHAPSRDSVNLKYIDDYYMNSGYYSALDSFILDHPQIKLWTHGHMHDSVDYNIGDTRIVCNPRGYRDENKGFNPNISIIV